MAPLHWSFQPHRTFLQSRGRQRPCLSLSVRLTVCGVHSLRALLIAALSSVAGESCLFLKRERGVDFLSHARFASLIKSLRRRRSISPSAQNRLDLLPPLTLQGASTEPELVAGHNSSISVSPPCSLTYFDGDLSIAQLSADVKIGRETRTNGGGLRFIRC